MRDDDSENIAGRLTDGGHELRQRVYFEDTDFSGRVYHARYLHFMERGRSDYLRLLGVHHRELAQEGLAFAVRHMEIDFLKPASIDEIVTVWTEPVEARGARVVLAQDVHRDDEHLIRARVTVALVGANGRAVRLPPEIRDRLARRA
jgi:acyl-CoA thioester hydrolase